MTQKVIQAGTVKKISRIWVVQADTTEKSPAVKQNKTKFCNARGETVRDPVILYTNSPKWCLPARADIYK